MNIANIIIFISSLICLFLATLIFLKNKKKFSNICLAVFVVNLSGWGISIAMMAITIDVICPRFAFWFISAAFICFTLFIKEYLKGILKFKGVNNLLLYIFVFIGLFFWSISFTELIIADVVTNVINGVYFTGVSLILGSLYNFLVTYYILNFLFILHLMVMGYKEATSVIVKSQMKYFFFGIMLFTVCALATNLILPFFGIFNFNNLGPTFSVIMIGFISYAITRYRFMDIRLIIVRSIVFSFLVLIITAAFSAVSALVTYSFANVTGLKSNIISSVAVVVFLVAFYQPLRRLVEGVTNSFLYKKSYDVDELLSEINQTTSSILNLDKLLESLSKILSRAFNFEKFGIVTVENGKLKIGYQSGFQEKVANQLINFKNLEKILGKELKRVGGTLVMEEMRIRHENEEFEPASPELLELLYQNDIALVAPLYIQGQLIGAFVLGVKKSGDLYTSQDLNVINIISGQTAIAIENARLYEEQKQFNIHLKKEVERATKKLELANKELQRLDDAKSEFLSIASHQLRTPSTAVKGYTSMILEGNFGKISKPVKESLEKVYLANERLLNLVESLLNISRIEAGREDLNIQPVDMAKIVKPIIEDFTLKAKEKKLKLSMEVEPRLPKAAGDASKIKEVVSNIIDNSLKYTNEGEIMVNLHQESQSIVFACQDTGIGIEPDDLPRLFNKFVRGKGMMQVHTEGTGLGIYYARLLVESMGGRIWAESPGKNQGAKFSFSLPMADKSKARKVGK